jgi:PAS domain S-box-containing protein
MDQSIKVLVIDDNIEFGIGVKMLLANQKVEVYNAGDGTEGLEMADRLKPDIILLDVVMPGINGIEVCSKIREKQEHSNVYIVMLSGIKISTDQMADGLESGADGYIARPIPNRELLARLRSFIRLKKTEKALERAEVKYKSLFDTMIIGYAHQRLILNNKGKPVDFEFLEVNPEFERLTGKTRSDILGKTVFDVFPETETYWLEKYSEVALNGTESRFVNYSRALGKFFEVYAFSPAKYEFSTLFYDVTDRELAREKIEKYNRELEELNRNKDTFFSIIAHDLRSPFNSIIGFSNLMKEDVNSLSANEIKEYAGFINLTAVQTLRLLENLLNWARLQQGKINFNPEKIRMDDAINEVFLMYTEVAKKKEITLINRFDSDVDIYGDEEMLKTILRNLVSNAIKFTGAGGQVTISLKDMGDHVVVEITDTGTGISDEHQKKLFQGGVNQSTPGTGNEKGTGLGLILCKDFVEKHGGSIRVESEEGKGSKFFFSLPKKKAAE